MSLISLWGLKKKCSNCFQSIISSLYSPCMLCIILINCMILNSLRIWVVELVLTFQTQACLSQSVLQYMLSEMLCFIPPPPWSSWKDAQIISLHVRRSRVGGFHTIALNNCRIPLIFEIPQCRQRWILGFGTGMNFRMNQYESEFGVY